jgi:hypothetical protein
MLGRTVERTDARHVPRRRVIHPARELRRDHVLVAVALDRAPDELLVRQRPVQLRRVEEVDPELQRAPDRRDRLAFVAGAVERRHPHAAQPQRRNLEVCQFAPVHRSPAFRRRRIDRLA